MSSATLGDLVVRLSADIASFELSMTRAQTLTNKFADDMESAIDKAKDSVKELAAAYAGFESIKAFAEGVEDATQFASSLELLSQRLGVSAETLGSFRVAAEQSGTSVATVAQGLTVLSKSMYDTWQGTGRAKVAFDSLHLSVTNSNGTLKDAGQFFVELSNKIASLKNPTEQNAIALKTMRGVGADLIPVMKAIADGAERESMVTDAQAVAAKHYTDELVLAKEVHEQFFNTVSQQVTPVLEALLKTYVDLSNGAGGLNSKTKELAAQNQIKQWAVEAGLGVTMLIDGLRYVVVGVQMVVDGVKILVDSAITGFEIIVGAVGTMFASLRDVETLIRGIAELMSGDFVNGMADVKSAFESMKAGWGGYFEDAKNKAQGLALTVDGLAGDVEKLMANFKQGAASQAFLDALDAINQRVDKVKKGVGGAGEAIKNFQASAIDKLIDKLDVERAKLEDNIDSWTKYGKAAEDTTELEVRTKMNEDAWIQTINKLAETRKAAGQSAADWIHQVQTQIIETAKAIDEDKLLLAQVQAWTTANKQAEDSVASQAEKQREANAVMGLGVTAVSDYNLALIEERLELAKVVPDNAAVVAALTAQVQAWKDLRAAQLQGKELSDQLSSWKDLAGIISNTATNAIENWGHAIGTLRDMLKSLLADMFKIFMTKWVLNLGAQMVGPGSQIGSMLSQAAMQQGQGTFAGTIYDYFAGNNSAASLPPPDVPGGYSDTYDNTGTAAGTNPGMMGYAGGAVGGAIAGYGYGGMMNQWFGNSRNAQGMSIGGAVGGAAGYVTGMALGAEYGSIAGPIGMVIGAVIGALLGSLIKSGGGPKEQGAYAASYDPGGNLISALNGPELVSITGDNQHRDTAMGITNLLASTYSQAAHGLGATNVGNMDYGFGFSTDPKGTAPGFIHSLVRDSSGNVIYQHNNDDAPRDSTQFQAEVQTETERMLVTGLQHTDLGPDLNKLFKDFGDVTTATKEDMDALLAKAQDLHTALVTLDAISKGAFGINISLDDLKAYQLAGETLTQTVNRVGGAWVQLVNQFEDPMTKLGDEKTNLAGLYKTLSDMGIQAPTTREGWLKIMQGLDQSTESGRNLFQQMLQLAGAFNDVQNASATMMQNFDQLMGRERPGYTQQQDQNQLNSVISQFMASNGWTVGMSAQQVLQQLHTITRDDFSKYDTATQQLILTILGLDDTINGLPAAIQQPLNPAYGGDAFNLAAQKIGQQWQNMQGVISGQPDTSHKISTQIDVTKDFISTLQARKAELEQQYAGYMMPAEYDAINQQIKALTDSLTGLSSGLATVTILEAQYGTSIGDQLYDLENWYNEQKSLVAGNNAAMLALEDEYQKKRTAILSGGNADATGAVQNWQQNIQNFLNSLLTGSISPLSPTEQLAAAQSNFEDLLTKAKGGDTNAQGQLQQAAQGYLNLARQQFASGSGYNDIFRKVYDELAGVASAPSYEDKMAAAIPEGKLASAADIAMVAGAVAELTTVVAGGIRVTDPAVAAAIARILSGSTTNTGVFA